ncbi:DUF4124 domain-containing protein [Pseudomonas sp. NPDC007930]|uniref:DUF4124 domain-containing protein n=1 Tax=Pseudomonas sp. NPDC007930 TaxID=3364417 RepID=UPI0036EB37FD
MRLKPLIALLLAAASTCSSAAQIYKWVDAKGVTHFDAQPPAGSAAQPVQINAPQPATPPGESGGNAPAPSAPSTSPGEEAKQRSVDAQVRQQVNQQQQQNDDYCQQARTNLAQLRNNPRVQMEVEGQMRRLTEKERQDQISTTQQGIADHCKD